MPDRPTPTARRKSTRARGRSPRGAWVQKPFLAIDLGGTKVAAAVVARDGHVTGRATEPVDRRSPAAPVSQLAALAAALAAGGEPPRAFARVGVAVPGLVRRNGTVWAPNLGWHRVPLARRLERLLGLPVVVESDRNAAVLGEAWRGAAKGKQDVIAVAVGTGIGAGILSGGRLIRGAHELSGCAGWLVVSERGRPVAGTCGSLESIAAGPGIAESARRAMASGEARARWVSAASDRALTARDVAVAAENGDQLALRLFREMGHELGLGVANLISLFDPEVVVIGGGMAGAAHLFMDTLRETALANCQPIAARHVRIRVSTLGGDANLLGAARLADGRFEP